ncbi:MAG: glycosyltransferase family 4 protein [Deltaproteobacteria bacterium]|nr:glycosyltransferase family 4 protein [Deltaproteobacteria bacterium]
MKVLFVSQYYPPESNAPANRVSRLARAWAEEEGFDVTVLTGFPNHPEGRVYPGFDARRPLRERDGRVKVVRAPIYAAANAGVLKRSLAYASFCTSASSLGPWLVDRPDVVIATSPQLLVGVAGAYLAKLLRRPFVLEVRDLWPDSVVAVGAMTEDHPVVRGLHVIEESLYRQADHIVVVTESFREILAERGVAKDKLSFVPNGVDRDLFVPGPGPDPDPYPGRFVVCFAGTVGMAHGLGTVLDAAPIAKREMPEVLFLVVGEGAERKELEARAQREGLDNVVFTGRVPRERVPDLLRRAEISLVMLKDDPLFKTVLPSKLFESMGCARPMLLGVDGEARRLVERAEAGRYFVPSDPRALLEGIRALANDPALRDRMGRAGHQVATTEFDRGVLAKRYAQVLRDIVLRAPGRKRRADLIVRPPAGSPTETRTS